MGFYRFALAIFVLISHAGITIFEYNPGVVAVISFFLLSGYVMTELIEKYYKRPVAIPTFYLDRVARLFPQFLFYMLLALICIHFAKIESPFLKNLTPFTWLLNFLMLPQGFFMFWADGALVIPQSWSLGLEATFYLAIPWIVVYCTKRQMFGLAGVSFGVFLAAYFGIINTDNFGYRLLPGTLYMFLVGASFARPDKYSRRFVAAVFLLTAILFLHSFLNERFYILPFNKEVLLGLLLGILVVTCLKDFQFSKRTARIDLFFGNLSYGVFLNHFIVIWMLQRFFGVKGFGVASSAVLMLISSALAMVSFFVVERPALTWRRAIRRGIGMPTSSTPPIDRDRKEPFPVPNKRTPTLF